MYKISITGKANSGKDTLSELISKKIRLICKKDVKNIMFASSIKKMVEIAFPNLPKDYLYGPSQNRSCLVPGAFKNGEPLTVRQLLMDLGNDFGRAYKASIWLDNFDYNYNSCIEEQLSAIIVSDTRFVNEINHLKSKGFFLIKLLRDNCFKINDISENSQDLVDDDMFDAIIDNNSSIESLDYKVDQLISSIISH